VGGRPWCVVGVEKGRPVGGLQEIEIGGGGIFIFLSKTRNSISTGMIGGRNGRGILFFHGEQWGGAVMRKREWQNNRETLLLGFTERVAREKKRGKTRGYRLC